MKQSAQNVLIFIVALVGVSFLMVIIFGILALLGVSPLGTGCFMRYSSAGVQSVRNITLRADGNYAAAQVSALGAISRDPDAYGKWKKTGWLVRANDVVNLTVSGDVSLCTAHVPMNNINGESNLIDIRNEDAPLAPSILSIPSIESNSSPVEFKFDARNCEWRNIAKLSYNDHVVITLRPNVKPRRDAGGNITYAGLSYTDPLSKRTETVDCTEGLTTYSPICGRYRSELKMYYVSECKKEYGSCPDYAWDDDVSSWTSGEWTTRTIVPYKDDGSRTYAWSNDLNSLSIASRMLSRSVYISNNMLFPVTITAQSICDAGWAADGPRTTTWTGYTYCAYGPNKHPYTYTYAEPTISIPSDIKSWYSADTATALLYRFSENERGGMNSIGTAAPMLSNDDAGYRIAKVLSQGPYGQQILNYKHTNSTTKYLQFRPATEQCHLNVGGYIIGIKQTTCSRHAGQVASDTFRNRGQIKYLILPQGSDPNSRPPDNNPANEGHHEDGPERQPVRDPVPALTNPLTSTASNLTVTNGAATFTAGSDGMLWMIIDNDPADIQDSAGQYTIQQSITTTQPSFSVRVLTPLLESLRSMVTAGGTKMFRNMICYQSNNKAPCINFFTYIKAMLTLYIVIFALMFLLGMVQISQKDLVIRIVKIAIVSGLLSGQTFDLFRTYVFDFAINFSDQIISNLAGYSLFTSGGASNPMMFADDLLSKIFFSPVFITQVLATMSFGICGIFYFILILITLIVCVITLLRAIAVYIMAFVAVALLLGLAPFFLVFMLFQQTYYLFENWSRFLFRYMIEPAILMAGITILTKLFTIYLDHVLGYSVCWKCALEFKLPFPQLPGLPSGLLNVPLFCINWFGPWGLDSSTGSLGMNMQNILALLMIAYVMYGYTHFAGQLVGRLTNTPMAPGATQMGQSMSSTMGQAALGAGGLDEKNRDRKMQSAERNFDDKMKSIGGEK